MSPRTKYLARLIGCYCVLVPLMMVLEKQATVETVNAMLRNPPMMYLLGLVGVIGGLALVIGHNVWSGGAVTVIVTLTGWITLIKGLIFMWPEAAPRVYIGALRWEQLYYFYAAFSIVLGAYLIYGSMTRAG